MAEKREMATHQMPATLTGNIIVQSAGHKQQEGLARSQGAGAPVAPSRSLNILSSILRGPLPNPRAPHPANVSVTVDPSQQVFPKTSIYRSVSPVRVITSSSQGGPQQSMDPKSLSPSRTPTTLPPKKSLSPSRIIYTEQQVPQQSQQRFHQASPPQRVQFQPQRGLAGSQNVQLQRSNQSEIQQALLQQIPAEALFKQYKIATAADAQGGKGVQKGVPVMEGLTRDMIAVAEQAVNTAPRVPTQIIFERRSPSAAQNQPKPAHQAELRLTPPTHVSTIRRTPSPAHMPIEKKIKKNIWAQNQPKPAHQSELRLTPPTHVSTIRRTPSPAHMPIGTDIKIVKVEAGTGTAGGDKQQAVNLSKPHERHPSGGWISHTQAQNKPSLEPRMSEEFRYGDLLQSIQRSQDEMQRGLSPITPSDPLESTKPWNTNPVPASQATAYHPQLHGRIEGLPTTSHGQPFLVSAAGGFIPIPMSLPVSLSATSVASSGPPVGTTQVVFPSPVQRLASPKAQRAEPTSTILHHAQSTKSRGVHNVPSSIHSLSAAEIKQPVVNLVRLTQADTEVKDTVKVFPGQDRSKVQTQPSLASVTLPGPPNVTITTSSSIFPHEKTFQSQRLPRNPFTFPPTPPVTLSNEFTSGGKIVQTSQSKLTTDSTEANQKQRHISEDMPCLMPVSPYKDKKEAEENLVPIPQPYNMRVQTLANLPNNSTYRPTYRATSVAVHRAKAGCITSAAKSLDILRQNLQKSMNTEIKAVIQKYIDKFFKVGLENIKLNNGDNSVSEEHMQAVCRQILEEAKKMYTPDTGRRSISPARELSDVSETGSNGRRSALGRKRNPSDTDSENNLRAPGIKKKKGRHLLSLTGRSTPSKLSKELWKREGPKFEPERLTESTRFVMGSKANKAMGFGATRGRLYMKHPDLFKYNGDQDDKVWLYENHHMPATGGKSYLVVLEDIKELAQTEEYQNSPGISIMDIAGFSVPMWMIEKMRHQMLAMRTDLPKLPKHRSRSVTPNIAQEGEDGLVQSEELPFANFSSPKETKVVLEAANADEDLEFLSSTAIHNPSTRMSPFNMTGGFDDGASDLDTLEDDPMMGT